MNKPKIRYQVAVESITSHLFSVQLEIARPDPDGQKLSLPAWIPGSYMIRDFAKNIVSLSAFSVNGIPLKYNKIDKQTWRIEPQQGAIRIQYQVYANDLSVRSAFISDDFAFFNGTSVFLEAEGQDHSTIEVEIFKPNFECSANWKVATAMPLNQPTQLHEFGVYHADNYAQLIDHPILLGDYDLVSFHTNNVDFELVLVGGHHADLQRIEFDLKKICQHHITLFNDTAPVERYLFITLLTHDGFGGLEHCDSTALLYSRNDLPSEIDKDKMTESYRTFLSLCSHELFHTWLVKRIKPAELQDVRLDREAFTEQLWIYEGFTSFYDDISLARSGVIEPTSYLELMGQNLTRLLRNQGRHKQTITESSYDAWTKFYQQDASAINNIVSYYNKGAVVAMCLDILIRNKSGNQQSLDDLIRYLWQLHGKTGLATSQHTIQQILEEKMHIDLDAFLQLALYSTEELPSEKLLALVGIKMKTRPRSTLSDKGGKAAEKPCRHYFGISAKAISTGLSVTQVLDKSPACIAGLMVGDQLISVDNWQVNADSVQRQLDLCHPGTNIKLHVLRDNKMKEFTMPVMPAPEDTVYLEIEDNDKLSQWLTTPI